jgi:hypothetical protein
MAIPFLNNINLSDNQLLNAKLHVTGTAPTAASGQIYFDSTSDTVKYYDGVAWIELTQNTNNYLSGLAFNTGSGVLTASVVGQSDVTVDLDGRYALSSSIPGSIVESVTTGNANTITIGGTAANPTVAANTAAVTNGSLNLVTGDAVYDFTTALPISTFTNDTGYITGNQTITLSGEATGSGTTSISVTISNGVLDVANFNGSAIVTESEGIANNDNDTTIPTSAAVKAYVDDSVAGGLVYQGGYNAATNTPNLESPTAGTVNQGFTYTVTADGLFFDEQVRVGDILIAEVDDPSAIGDWTTAQNNIDLADASTVGLGNVATGTGLDVSYSGGTGTITIDASEFSQADGDEVLAYKTGSNALVRMSFSSLADALADVRSYAITISDTATVTHNLGTTDVMVQLFDVVTGETVYADIDRTGVNTISVIFATTPSNNIRVLVQKIG